MVHVERLMQGTSQKDELHMTLAHDNQAKVRPFRQGQVSGSTVSFIILYLFKEDVDGRS